MGKWGTDCDFTKKPELKIATIRDRWVKAKHDLEDAQYIEQLVFHDFVRSVCNSKTVWDYRIPMIKAARDEIGKNKKKERANISYIEGEIKESFFKDDDRIDIKIHKIIQGGYEGYHWNLYFNIGKEEYCIIIPNREMIDSTNITYAYEGKFVFEHTTSECSSCVEFMDWSEEGFAQKCKEYFEKENAND